MLVRLYNIEVKLYNKVIVKVRVKVTGTEMHVCVTCLCVVLQLKCTCVILLTLSGSATVGAVHQGYTVVWWRFQEMAIGSSLCTQTQ